MQSVILVLPFILVLVFHRQVFGALRGVFEAPPRLMAYAEGLLQQLRAARSGRLGPRRVLRYVDDTRLRLLRTSLDSEAALLALCLAISHDAALGQVE